MGQMVNRQEDLTGSSTHQFRKFGARDKFGYMFGDWGNDFFFILVAAFLMVYYTDVFHLNPAFVGTLFLIARIWDAIADVTWGRFIDTRKATKNGKFRPWIFRMSIPLVIIGVLMFVKIPGMPMGFYEAYAFVTYILWGTLYSTVNIPYGSMASVITEDPVERTSLSSFRSLGGALAGFFITVVGPLILFDNNQATAGRFLLGAVIFGILAITCYMACYKLTTERIQAPEPTGTSKGNLGTSLKALGKNGPLIWILVASFVFIIAQMFFMTTNAYLFKDYFENAKAQSIAGIIQIVAVFCTMPLVAPLVRKFGKKEFGAIGMLVAALAYGILYFIPNISLTVFFVFLFIGYIGFGVFNLIIWAFVTDVLDYHEYLTGKREDGTLYSIYSFARKVGQAVAGALGGYAIAIIGYNSTLSVQTKSTIDGIYTLSTIVPAIFFIIVFLVLVFFYPLNKKRTLQLTNDLAERRASK